MMPQRGTPPSFRGLVPLGRPRDLVIKVVFPCPCSVVTVLWCSIGEDEGTADFFFFPRRVWRFVIGSRGGVLRLLDFRAIRAVLVDFLE